MLSAIVIMEDGEEPKTDFSEQTRKPDEVIYCFRESRGKTVPFSVAVNGAVKKAKGEFILFLRNGAEVSENFVDEMARTLKKNRLVSASVSVRNLADIVKKEQTTPLFEHFASSGVEAFPIKHQTPWVFVSFSGLAMAKEDFQKIGGVNQYLTKGFIRCGWSVAMKAYFSGIKLWKNTVAKAIVPEEQEDLREAGLFVAELKDAQIKRYGVPVEDSENKPYQKPL